MWLIWKSWLIFMVVKLGITIYLSWDAFRCFLKVTLLWDPILMKMDCRLLKSALSSLLSYYLSLFTIPTSVTNRLEKLQRNFLCVTSDVEFKFPLVAWGLCVLLLLQMLEDLKVGKF